MTLETIALLSHHNEYEENNNILKDICLPEGFGVKSCKVDEIEDADEKIEHITRLVEIIVGTSSKTEDLKVRPEEDELWKQINETEFSTPHSISRRNSTKSIKHEFIEWMHINEDEVSLPHSISRRNSVKSIKHDCIESKDINENEISSPHSISRRNSSRSLKLEFIESKHFNEDDVNSPYSISRKNSTKSIEHDCIKSKQIYEPEVSSPRSICRRNSAKSLKHEFIESAQITNIVLQEEESDFENDTHYTEPDFPKEDVELMTFYLEKENDVAVRTDFVLETIYEIPGAKVNIDDNIQTESDESEEDEPVPIESRILGTELVEFRASKKGHSENTDNKNDHVKHPPFDEHHLSGKGILNFKIKKSKKGSRKCSLVDQFEYLESRRQPSIRKKKKTRSSKGHLIIADEPILQENIGLFKNSELNCYMDLLKHKCKAEHGAFIDLDGKLLLQDWGMNLENEAAASVVRVIESFQNMNKTRVSLFKLTLGRRETTCFRLSDYSFVGMTENYFTYAHKCTDFVVLVLSDPESHGSCMFQVNKFVRHVNNNSK